MMATDCTINCEWLDTPKTRKIGNETHGKREVPVSCAVADQFGESREEK